MSRNSVLQFRQSLNESPEMQAELRSVIDGELYAEDLIAVASKHGFEITADDLDQVIGENEDTELSDFELELVSGGLCGRSPGNKDPNPPKDGEDAENEEANEPVQVTGSFMIKKPKISLPKIKRRW